MILRDAVPGTADVDAVAWDLETATGGMFSIMLGSRWEDVLRPVIATMPDVSCGIPARSRIVGARSMKLTKSSTTRPGVTIPFGQRIARGTRFESG